jgi:hypothetical protein
MARRQPHRYVYHSPLQLPCPHQRIKPRAEEAGRPSMNVTLHAGDVLYLPRGWIHDARTFNTESMHVTMGVQVPPALILGWGLESRHFESRPVARCWEPWRMKQLRQTRAKPTVAKPLNLTCSRRT